MASNHNNFVMICYLLICNGLKSLLSITAVWMSCNLEWLKTIMLK